MAVFLGESVPRFDLVMGLVGSTLTGPLMFIFPPLFFLRLCYMKSYKQKYGDNVKLTEQSINQNGDQARQQNGATSNFPLILRNSFHNTYRTFTSGYENIDGSPLDEYDIKLHDILLAAIVAIIGLITTVIATYCSWSDTISSAQFSPPCISNITAAARSFLEVTKPMWYSLNNKKERFFILLMHVFVMNKIIYTLALSTGVWHNMDCISQSSTGLWLSWSAKIKQLNNCGFHCILKCYSC